MKNKQYNPESITEIKNRISTLSTEDLMRELSDNTTTHPIGGGECSEEFHHYSHGILGELHYDNGSQPEWGWEAGEITQCRSFYSDEELREMILADYQPRFSRFINSGVFA